MHNWPLIIINIAAALIIIAMILLLFLFYRKKTSVIIKQLEVIEKETKKIEDMEVNNTVSLADIHGIVSSFDGKHPYKGSQDLN